MGSDYHMQDIEKWEDINGSRVPIARWGAYLDWRGVNDEETKALDLTTPYGILEYAVGNSEGDEECEGDWTTFYDFAELPDGSIVLDSTINSESGGFIEGGGYHRVSKNEAPGYALAMVDLACECLCLNEVRHDADGWNQDEYYFVRAVARHCGVEPYASMNYEQLRRGDRPDFPGDYYGEILSHG